MTILALLAGTAAAASTFAFTPRVIRYASAHDLLSRPERRHIHHQPVPRVGGIAILAGALLGLAVALLFARAGGLAAMMNGGRAGWLLAGLLAGGSIAFAAGLVDDVRGLRPIVKLGAQVVAALLVYAMGLRIEQLGWNEVVLDVGWLALPLTILWIVGVTNAYNLVDGMDGLATGLGVIAFAATLAAAVSLGNALVVVVAAVLLGALVGFLPYNFSPARIFMGDSGSLFVGFVLALLSVHGSMKGPTAVLVAVPLFALAIPLLDTLVTIVRRWLRGSPLSEGDTRHIHHRLLALGLTQRGAVLLLYSVGAGFAVLGILLAFAPRGSIAVIAGLGGVASVGALVTGMRRLGYDEFMLAGKVLASGPHRARRAIRERILANDLAQVIRVAWTIEEMQAVLTDAADEFGLLHMELCGRGLHAWPGSDTRAAGSSWSLDFPLCLHGDARDPLVLRIHAPIPEQYGSLHADTVAYILGESLRERLAALEACCGNVGVAGEAMGGPRRAQTRDLPGARQTTLEVL